MEKIGLPLQAGAYLLPVRCDDANVVPGEMVASVGDDGLQITHHLDSLHWVEPRRAVPFSQVISLMIAHKFQVSLNTTNSAFCKYGV